MTIFEAALIFCGATPLASLVLAEVCPQINAEYIHASALLVSFVAIGTAAILTLT